MVSQIIKPRLSEHPKYKSKEVTDGRLSLTRGLTTGALNFESNEPVLNFNVQSTY